MVEIKLKEGESGYDAVVKYVERYWKHHSHDDAIVSVAISYDGESYDYLNEVCSPDSGLCGVMFLSDWWEGQKYIRLFGITNVSEYQMLCSNVKYCKEVEDADR